MPGVPRQGAAAHPPPHGGAQQSGPLPAEATQQRSAVNLSPYGGGLASSVPGAILLCPCQSSSKAHIWGLQTTFYALHLKNRSLTKFVLA